MKKALFLLPLSACLFASCDKKEEETPQVEAVAETPAAPRAVAAEEPPEVDVDEEEPLPLAPGPAGE